LSSVFVVDAESRPLNPVHPGHARRLLKTGSAAVWRRYPFTLIRKRVVPHAVSRPLRLKIDPGSRATGMALVEDATGQVVWAAQLPHRGRQVHERLLARRAVRRSRRSRRMRHTRYRPARFANRRRREGWLPPSLESRVQTVVTWVARLRRLAPVAALSQELVRFDTQLLANPEIDGVEYQQGELAGYEVREYVLEKWGRACAYCHTSGRPLELDHIVPRTHPGGSDRVSNLAPACRSCNEIKGNRTAADFGHPEVQAKAKQPLKDAAAMNATRWALHRRLVALDLPVEVGTGGRTKWNRTRRGLPKAHWTDAACVGASTPDTLRVWGVVPLAITAMGRHSRQMCRTDAYGFPDKASKATSVVGGFRTGDIVRAVVPAASTKMGVYVGRIAVRATGSCNIKTATGTVQGIHYRYCRPLHRGDGYAYQRGEAVLPPQA
jgi:5-methylcytosine-specific restriction endonuclease McrA